MPSENRAVSDPKRYFGMSKTELALARSEFDTKIRELKAKAKATQTKPYSTWTSQDRTYLQRVETEIARMGGEISAIQSAQISLKETEQTARAVYDMAPERRFVAACKHLLNRDLYLKIWRVVDDVEAGTSLESIQPEAVGAQPSTALAEKLAEANDQLRKLAGGETALEFVSVARIVLAESTFSRIHTRAQDGLRAKRKAAR